MTVCLFELISESKIMNALVLDWYGPAQKHQQGPITCSKWSNDSVQDKGIECIGFEGFNQVRLKSPLEYQEEALVHLIYVQERPNTTLFGP
jgi:hypothetical protein